MLRTEHCRAFPRKNWERGVMGKAIDRKENYTLKGTET